MPGYSLLSVVNLCLHLVKVSVIIELWIGGNPFLEAGISLIATLIGSLIGLVIAHVYFFDHLVPDVFGPSANIDVSLGNLD